MVEWESKYGSGEYGDELVRLRQSSHHVHGTMTCKIGHDAGNIYEFEGEFRNLILTATYKNRSKNTLDRGTMTLMLKDNGKKLEGYCCFYNDKMHEVVSTDYVWSRG